MSLHISYVWAVTQGMILYGGGIIFFCGVIGNILCFIILQRKPFRGSTFAILLSCLSLANIGSLCTGLLRVWVETATDTDMRAFSSSGCRAHIFFSYFWAHATSWLVALVTIERTVSLVPSLQHATKKRVLMASAGVIACLALLCIHPAVHAVYIVDPKQLYDPVTFEAAFFCLGGTSWGPKSPYSWMDFILVIFIPMVIVIVCLCVMVRTLKMHRRRKMTSKVLMVFALCFVYLVTVLPHCVFLFGLPWRNHGFGRVAIFHTVCFILHFISNAVNIFIFLFASKQFRQNFKNLFSCAPSEPIVEEDELIPQSDNALPEVVLCDAHQ